MPETLYLTVNLIDRFLEAKQVTRKHLQLVGVTAMLVASKYEEIWAPEVRDFVYISDRAYTRDQILNMEKIMLNTLRFNLTVPSECACLCLLLRAVGLCLANVVGSQLPTANIPEAWCSLVCVALSCAENLAANGLEKPSCLGTMQCSRSVSSSSLFCQPAGIYNFLSRNYKAAGVAGDK
jgi:hypothetical protein